jgi:hypothetical protein
MIMPFRSLALISFIGMADVCASAMVARSDEGTTRAEIAKWAGSDDTDAFLRQPAVHAELQKLLGSEMSHLMHNLDVRGSVELIGWTLSVSGNAPHQGTEEEAVVCVVPGTSMVEAAILSKGAVTVYTRAAQYEYTNRCIKDWITLANSGHVDRFEQPKNVRVVKPQ